jgi:TatD DNase family protein
MIDTHAHLDFKDFDEDREEVIARFFEMARLDLPDGSRASRGEKAIINIGVDLERSKKSLEIANQHEKIFAAVGIHPDYFSRAEEIQNPKSKTQNKSKLLKPDDKNPFKELKILAKNKKVIAIGETGLDYFSHTGTPITEQQKKNQKNGFLAQIELAQELKLPVIVHCRDAWEDLYEIVKFQYPNPKSQNQNFKILNTKFVLHCYSGEKKDTEKFLKLPNVYFSFSGNITYPKPADRHNRLEEAVQMIPLDRIMLDSDSPFLAPQKKRGKRNEPVYVSDIAEEIAKTKGISAQVVECATDENAVKFFGLHKFGLHK